MMNSNNQIDIFSVESWLNLAATAAELAEFTKRQPLAGEFPEQKLARLEREMPMTKLARLVREMADIKLKQPVRENLPQAGAEMAGIKLHQNGGELLKSLVTHGM